jgi:DNA-binding CsgD family transcriptional regulator
MAGEAITAAEAGTGDASVTVTVDDLAPAVAGRLIGLEGGQLTFHHPLVRSAILQAIGAGRRRTLHRALASALGANPDAGQGGGAVQPERRIWHLAAATDEPDEQLAAELDAMAADAQRRGNTAVAVPALEEAARLSPDAGNRADRLLRAAECGVELGRHDLVDRLLGQAVALSLTGQQRVRVTWIRSEFDDGVRDQATGTKGLADLAAEVAADGNADLAVRILWSAALRCTLTEPGADARNRIVAVAESLPVDQADARLLGILACAAPIDRGAVVIERSRRLLARPLLDPDAARLVATAALMVGTFDVAITQAAAAVPALQAQGRVQLAARALASQSWAAAQVVDLAVAIPATIEGAKLAQESGQPYILATIMACQAKLDAVRGRITEALTLAGEAEALGAPVGARHVLATVQHARALAALAAGDHEQALARLLRMHDPADPCCQLALRCHTVADLADAASRCERSGDITGDAAAAVAGVIAEMEDFALRTPSPSLHDGLRLARAVLAADEAAEMLFQEALSVDLSRRPFIRARTELAYGEWLRRQRRAADSRHPLRSARDTFDALGATPWSERARRELRAAGERSAERKAMTSDLLTGQELQIAQLAASGLTNREIGKALFISHRTVGAHLARIFPKLDVTSRVQLASLLGDAAVL